MPITLNERWGLIGHFIMRYNLEDSIIREVRLEATKAGANWPLLQSGLFDRSIDKFYEVENAYTQYLAGHGVNLQR